MDWSKQAETMMETWGEAQKKMWESWFELAKNTSSTDSSQFSMFPNMMKQWQELATQGIDYWEGADPMARNAAKQMLAGQEAMTRMLKMTTRAWQAMAPKVDAGEDWQTVLKDYSNQWLESLTGGPMSMLNSGTDMAELWKFYTEEWQKIAKPWTQLMQDSPGNMGQIMLGGGSELAELTRLHWDVYERTFGGMTEIPGMGYNRELNQKLLTSFDTWVELQKISAKFHVLIAETSAKAFERVMEDLVAISERGESIDSIQDLMNLWMEATDQTFVRMYNSEDYLEVQKELAASVMQYKMDQQQVLEVVLNMMDLPTRTELDDAYKSLYQVEKEVKALKKEMKAMKSSAPAAKTTATRKKTTKRKTSAASKSTKKSTPEVSAEAVTNGQKGGK